MSFAGVLGKVNDEPAPSLPANRTVLGEGQTGADLEAPASRLHPTLLMVDSVR